MTLADLLFPPCDCMFLGDDSSPEDREERATPGPHHAAGPLSCRAAEAMPRRAGAKREASRHELLPSAAAAPRGTAPRDSDRAARAAARRSDDIRSAAGSRTARAFSLTSG